MTDQQNENTNAWQRSLPSPQALNAVECYSGMDDAHAWLETMNTMAELYDWPEDICLRVVKLRFKGPAQRWIARRKFDDWEDFQEQFLRRFGETRESALARLNRCSQHPREAPKAFADRFLEDAERAGRTEDEALVLQFLNKLRPDLRKEAARRRPQSIDEIVDFCNYWLGAMEEETTSEYPRGRPVAATDYYAPRRVRFAEMEEEDEDVYSYRTSRPRSDDLENRRPTLGRYNNTPRFNDKPRERFTPRWNDCPLASSNNNIRSFRPFNRDQRPNPPQERAAQAPAPGPKAASAGGPDIDALIKSFQRLELNMSQLMQDKDKEIRRLRYALQQQGRPTAAPQFNYLASGTTPSAPDEQLDNDNSNSDHGDHDAPMVINFLQSDDTNTCADDGMSAQDATEYAEQIDPDYLTMLYHDMYVKHGRDGDDVYQRMPHKRVAFDPAVSPYTPGLRQQRPAPPATHLTNDGGKTTPGRPNTTRADQQPTNQISRRMPRDRTSFDVAPGQAPPPPDPRGQAPASRPTGGYTPIPARPTNPAANARVNLAPNSPSQAAMLANNKGREMAEQLRKNLKFEACQDANLIPQAVLTCVAGYLADDARLIELGQNMAKQSEAVVHKLSPNRRLGSNRSTTPEPGQATPPSKLNSMQTLAAQHPLGPVNLSTKAVRRWFKKANTAAPCAVVARINGKEVEAVVDTGACTTAVTEDCLRRLNLLDTINKDIQWPYYNADGRPTAGVGVAAGLQFGLGSVTTLINPCVTRSQTYDMLIGADLLQRLRCLVDVGEKQLSFQSSTDQWESAPLVEPTPRCLDSHPLMNYLASIPAPEAYVETVTPYYEPPAPHKRTITSATDYVELAMAWWDFAGSVFDLPPEPSTTPGWMRCISDNNQQDKSNRYEDWMADRIKCIDEAEQYLMEHYYNADDPAVVALMGEMQDLAFAVILRGDTPGPFTTDFTACSTADEDSDSATDDTIDMTMYLGVPPATPTQQSEASRSVDQSTVTTVGTTALDAQTDLHTMTDEGQSKGQVTSSTTKRSDSDRRSHDDPDGVASLICDEDLESEEIPSLEDASDSESEQGSDDWTGADHLLSTMPVCKHMLVQDESLPRQPDKRQTSDQLQPLCLPCDHKPAVHRHCWQETTRVNEYTFHPARATNPSEDHHQPVWLPSDHQPAVHRHRWPEGTTQVREYTFHPAPDAGPVDPCTFPDDILTTRHNIEVLEQMIDSSNCDLTAEQKVRALDFIYANADVFCMTPEDLGQCNTGEHVIDTGDAAPIKQPYYKMPQKKYDQLREHIDYLLKLGLIRPSTSPWSSPAHLVPKPKGEPGATRMVVDYRALNAVSRKDATPLPTVNDVLWNLGPAKYVSCCDLANGYWQLKMSEKHDSIAKSAFATPWGLFEWLVTPFGLTGAPASFVKTLTTLLHDYIGQFVFLYLDDFICYSNSFEAHLNSLGLVFDRLRSANLKINPKKCSLFKQQVTFLGFVLDQTGLHPDPRLLDTIRHRGPPRNVKQTLSFLGLCGYFRRFVQGFAQIAEPLHKLTRKETPWLWGPEQQAAFTTLKDRLLNYPVLRRIDPNKRLFVYCDGSTSGIGACICQRESDDETGPEYVVAWHSRKLDKHQSQWPITDIEAFAVVDACCNVFKPLLYGREFCVVTDHNALLFLLTAKGLSGRVLRWSLKLMELMPFSLRYCKGTANKVADALSRDPAFLDHDDDNEQPIPAAAEVTWRQVPLVSTHGLHTMLPCTPGTYRADSACNGSALDVVLPPQGNGPINMFTMLDAYTPIEPEPSDYTMSTGSEDHNPSVVRVLRQPPQQMMASSDSMSIPGVHCHLTGSA